MPKVKWFIKAVLVLTAAVWFVAAPAAVPPAAAELAEPEPGGEIALFSEYPVSFNQWYYEDCRRLREIYDRYEANPEKERALVYAGWQAIAGLMTKTALNEAYCAPVRGYTVYPAETSGKLHVLGAARAARENFLALGETGMLAETGFEQIYPPLEKGSSLVVQGEVGTVEYLPAGEDSYVPLATAVETLNGLALPEKALQGYRVFLVPYKFRDLGGFFYSTGLPRVEETAFISAVHNDGSRDTESAIAHETGHFMHHRYAGEYTGENDLWRQYLALRGEKWREGAWSELTTENFAEDFRVACGNDAAASSPYAGDYGAPGASARSALQEYFRDLAERGEPLPVEFGSLFYYPTPGATAVLPIDGLENTDTVLVNGRKLQIRGAFKINDPAYRAVVYIKSADNDYEKCLSLQMLPEGVFAQELELPGPGSYDLVAGYARGSNITTCQLVKMHSYDFTYRLSTREKVAGGLTSPPRLAGPEFGDMDEHWAGDCVSRLAGMGLVNGYPDGNFYPENKITRSEFVNLLVKAAGLAPAAGGTALPFTDVTGEHWSFTALERAVSGGLVRAEDCPGGLFRPDDPVTRGEMAAFTEHYFDAQESGLAGQSPLALGVFSGYPDGSYGLERTSTRAEAMVVLNRLMELIS